MTYLDSAITTMPMLNYLLWCPYNKYSNCWQRYSQILWKGMNVTVHFYSDRCMHLPGELDPFSNSSYTRQIGDSRYLWGLYIRLFVCLLWHFQHFRLYSDEKDTVKKYYSLFEQSKLIFQSIWRHWLLITTPHIIIAKRPSLGGKFWCML